MTKVRKRFGMFAAFLMVLLMTFSLLGGLNLPAFAAETEENGDTCLITIDNGAASANTDVAVNGLHVYDPDSEELDDFISGAEVPMGSRVTVFVYNLASPVLLTIEHNNEIVTVKRFETMQAWVDDDKVEFFEFTLEGDLTVTTEALPEEETEDAKDLYDVHVENGDLAKIASDGTYLSEGSKVSSGNHEFEVITADQDVEFTLTMQSKEDAGKNAVKVINPLKDDGVSVYLGTEEDTRKTSVSEESILLPQDSAITVDVSNASEKNIAVTAIADGKVAEYTQLDGMTEDADGPVLWSAEEKLSGDMTIIVSERAAAEGMHTVMINNDAQSDVEEQIKNELIVTCKTQEEGSGPAELKETACLEDGTRIHVELKNKDADVELTVIQNGKTADIDDNAALDFELSGDVIILVSKAREAGTETSTIIDAVKLDANSSYTVSNVVVTGDLFFDFAALSEAESYAVTVENRTNQQLTVGYVDDSNGAPTAVDIVSGQSYKKGLMIGARGINTLTDRTLVLSAYVNGALANSVEIDPMKGTLEGANGLYVTLSGPTSFVLDYGTASEPAPEPTPVPAGNSCTVTVNNEAAKANTDDAVNGLHVYDTTSFEDVTGSKTFEKGTEIEFYVYNCASPVHLKAEHNGQVIADKDFAQMTAWVDDDKVEFYKVKLEGDLTVTATAMDTPDVTPTPPVPEKDKTYTVTVVNPLASEGVSVNLSWVDFSGEQPKAVQVKSGETVAEDTGIFVQVLNDSKKIVAVTAAIGGKELESTKIAAGEAGGLIGADYSGLALTGNMTVTVEEKATEPENMCKVTVDNGAAEANTDDAVNAIHVYKAPDGDDIEKTADFEAGTEIEFFVYNYASPVHLKVVHNGEVIIEKDYDPIEPYVDDDKIEFHNVTLEGDLEIITSAVESKKEDIEPDTPEKTYTVTVVNPLAGEGVAVNLSRVDFSGEQPKAVTVKSGEAVAENTGIFVQVLNDSEKAVTVTASIGGKELESEKIAAGEAGGLMGADYSGLVLTGDMTITVTAIAAEKEEESSSFTVNITGDKASEAEIYIDWETVSDGDTIEKGEHDIMIMGEGTATVYVGGVQADDAQDASYAEFYGVDVTADLTIDVSSGQ